MGGFVRGLNHTKPYKEVMWALAGFQNYTLYNGGSGIEPGDTIGSRLGNLYPKRVIYNFDYYVQPWKNNRGAIGSNGTIYPCDEYARGEYINNLGFNETNSYAKRLSDFIALVQDAAYTDKVHIVAHSMGGVVARAAIKWYGCNSKVNRLLMIATPNFPQATDPIGQMVVFFFQGQNPSWMKYGELYELTNWRKFCPGNNEYLDFLNSGDWAGGVKYGIIAGCLPASGLHVDILIFNFEFYAKDDGLLDISTVLLHSPGVQFLSIYRAAHGTSGAFDTCYIEELPDWVGDVCLKWYYDTYGEFSITSSVFTLECIREWVIQDTVRKGPLNPEDITVIIPPAVKPGEDVTATLIIQNPSAENLVAAQIIVGVYRPAGQGYAGHKCMPLHIDGNNIIYSLGKTRRDDIDASAVIRLEIPFKVASDLQPWKDYICVHAYGYSMNETCTAYSSTVPVIGGD